MRQRRARPVGVVNFLLLAIHLLLQVLRLFRRRFWEAGKIIKNMAARNWKQILANFS